MNNVPLNYVAIIVCAILSMVLGAIWYGTFFGKKWGELYGPKNPTPEQIAMMKKQAGPLYLLQFALSLFQLWVLAWFVAILNPISSGAHTAFGIYIGFVATTIIGANLWTGDSKKTMTEKILIQLGYQLIFFVLFGYILSVWR